MTTESDGAGEGFINGRWLGGLAAGVAVGAGISLAIAAVTARLERRKSSLTPTPLLNARTRPRGWRSVVFRAAKDFGQDRIPAAAASVTFYFLLALFPAMAAFVSLYGLTADLRHARLQVAALGGVLPGGAIGVLSEQLTRLESASHAGLGLAFFTGLLISIWSANAGMKAMIAGLNTAYEVREGRGVIRLNVLSLALTLGFIVLAVAATTAVVSAPATLSGLGLDVPRIVSLARWPAFMLLSAATFSVLYRCAPDHHIAGWKSSAPGALLAALGWFAMSCLFSWYVANFGHYDKTYGSLGAMVGFLTWIWLSIMVVLFGAELNSEIEARRRPG